MSQSTNLKDLERKMYRTYFDDGSWDIYIGLLLIWNTLFGLLLTSIQPEALRYGVMLLGFLLIAFVPNLMRKYITAPRLGKVEFSKARKRRISKMKFFVFFAVLLTANLVLITAIVLRNPTLSAESQTRSSFPIAVGFFIALIFAGLAYYLDFNRMFFYAAAIGAAITSTMIFDNPISYMIAGFPMVIIGLIYLSRFIKTYPKPDKVLNHGS